MNGAPDSGIGRHIWDTRYRWRDGSGGPEARIEDSWRRIARALATAEPRDREAWAGRFYQALADFRFLPGGRIQAGAGTGGQVTLFNCFVMGVVEDTLDGIFESLHQAALTMQQGGGIGCDFSTLRPAGTPARSSHAIASGPVSFMRIWDAMCATLLSTGARRGAMMATLRCDHPDIETFIDAKRDPAALRHFNLSVLASDDFMAAVHQDRDWALAFPEQALDPPGSGETLLREWTGSDGPVRCRVLRRVRARELWERILRANWDAAEPGVLFIDRINRQNNLYWRERITATNPCGEIPLPPWGACDLGAINLTRFVEQPFSSAARLDLDGIRATAAVAVRMLDNVIDVSGYPLPEQAAQARGARRVGLGITGLADALIMLGLRYGEPASLELANGLMREICLAAYSASVGLAAEKGRFPFYQREAWLAGEFAGRLPGPLRAAIARDGIRNSHLVAIAPTGTISLLAGNVSSGIEPVFAFRQQRRVLEADGSTRLFTIEDHALGRWRELRGEEAPPAHSFVSSADLAPAAHLDMQASLQPWVDNAISKTINVPEDLPFDEFRELYDLAWHKGLKGCTTFRPNPVTGAVVMAAGAPTPPVGVQCCDLEREAD